MTKLIIRYCDGKTAVVVLNEGVNIGQLLYEIRESCRRHGMEAPEFSFDEWEGAY